MLKTKSEPTKTTGPRSLGLADIPEIVEVQKRLGDCEFTLRAAEEVLAAAEKSGNLDASQLSAIDLRARRMASGKPAEEPVTRQKLLEGVAVAKGAVELLRQQSRELACRYSPLVCDTWRAEHTAAVRRLAAALNEAKEALAAEEAIVDGLRRQGVAVDFVRPFGAQNQVAEAVTVVPAGRVFGPACHTWCTSLNPN